ncbi:class I SAM-dependent methyltransferase [Streptomyces sp. SKN60]|uniref:class I SAM-dependent methyltransferase n=1 Tax=Streptomyces sp. SKN60 TaxID=2855506 RepID=UPI0022459682|nr:class I SAM-dependent methyltransferase [Streptomyces sp. SKN60]MCX2179756.1 class I SAM-dependent methyltransferase [Streptomyces sp. SKN60]
MSGFLEEVRAAYDTVAEAYAERVPAPGALDPLSRGVLGAFVEEMAEAGGTVLDAGCGPGKVAGYLAAGGVRVVGVDLSARMVGIARRAQPEVPFAVGSMTALGVRDGALAGVLAYYSTHHTPPEHLPAVYAEFRRVLAPGGRLMLAGYVGADGGGGGGEGERLRHTEAYGGLPVSYESHYVPPERIARLLEEAGLTVTARLVQEVETAKGAKRSVGTFLAVRPPAGTSPRSG